MTLQFQYSGRDRIPGITPEQQTFTNEFTFGRWENRELVGAIIDGSTRDVGNTPNTAILRAGLLLGQNQATDKIFVWNPAAVDGTEYILGMLRQTIVMTTNQGTDQDRMTGPVVISGGVLNKRLIVPGNTALGIVGDSDEWLIRQQMRNRFIIDDTFMEARPEIQHRTVTGAEQAGGITLTARDSHNRLVNTGGTLAVALTGLSPFRGLRFEFSALVTTTDIITITSDSVDIITPGSSASATLVVDGATVAMVGDGSTWLVDTL